MKYSIDKAPNASLSISLSPSLLVSLSVLVALNGCAPAGEFSGSVRYQAKLVPDGFVTVYDGEGIPKFGRINAHGSYTVKDLATGDCKICVARDGIDPEHPPKGWFAVPDKYMAPATSGIIYPLQRGANHFDIELQSQERP